MNTVAAQADKRLEVLAGLGGYFVLEIDDTQSRLHLDELLETDSLRGLVERTRAATARSIRAEVARVPSRTAASTLHLGMVSRLLSPVVGAALVLGAIPVDADPRGPSWYADGHAVHFSHRQLYWRTGRSIPELAEHISRSVLDRVVAEIGVAVATSSSLSPRVIQGNVVSAANGAVTVLAMSHPHLAADGRNLIRALLDGPALAGAGSFASGSFASGGFRRNSCCLFYRVPGAGVCGDCVLTAPGAGR